MSETAFQVQLPSSLLHLGLSQDEIQRRIAEWLVLSLFTDGKISSGKAGKLLGLTRLEFIRLLASRGVAYINYDKEELAEELAAVEKLDPKK